MSDQPIESELVPAEDMRLLRKVFPQSVAPVRSAVALLDSLLTEQQSDKQRAVGSARKWRQKARELKGGVKELADLAVTYFDDLQPGMCIDHFDELMIRLSKLVYHEQLQDRVKKTVLVRHKAWKTEK